MLEVSLDVKASPDVARVATRVRTTNWKENRYERICLIHDQTLFAGGMLFLAADPKTWPGSAIIC